MFIPRRKNGETVALTNAMLYSHLRGHYAVAVYAGPQSSRFVTFDVDTTNPSVVRVVMEAIER